MLTLSYFWIYLLVFYNGAASPNTNYVHMVDSSYWDAATGVDLKTTVYARIDRKKIKLGESNNKNILNLKIPVNVQSLIFESDGYVTTEKPVHFIGSFTKYSKFNIEIPVNKKEAVVVEKLGKQKYNRMQETMIFCVPDIHDKETEYELYRVKERFFITNFTIIINANRSDSYDGRIDHYLLVVKSKSGQILMEKDFFTKNGLNLIDLHTEKRNTSAAKTNEKIETNFEKGILYFDQSSHDLKAEAKLTLDSAASHLLNHREAKILVVGYTDNVGSKEPNIILSEYRARASSGYLQKKGVGPNQIITKWEGPNQQVKTANTPNEAVKNRRVVLEILK